MFSQKDFEESVMTASENPTFSGDFAVNFGGNAKRDIGAIKPFNPASTSRSLPTASTPRARRMHLRSPPANP